MAEQSMFWPTTGTGDGISGGYTSDRLASIWKAVLSDGVISYLNNLAVTGTGSSTLAINTGAAMVKGYLYENTTSVSIATSTLGSATYGLYIIANESASALTVSRSASGTSVASKTVRLALAATVPTQPYIRFGYVTTVAGSISSIDLEVARFARTNSVPNAVQVVYQAASLSVPTSTSTPVTGASLASNDSEFVTYDSVTGRFYLQGTGVYLVEFLCRWDTNTTNRRRLEIDEGRYYPSSQLTATSFITATYTYQSFANTVSGGAFVYCNIWQDSGTTRTVSDITIQVTRL